MVFFFMAAPILSILLGLAGIIGGPLRAIMNRTMKDVLFGILQFALGCFFIWVGLAGWNAAWPALPV